MPAGQTLRSRSAYPVDEVRDADAARRAAGDSPSDAHRRRGRRPGPVLPAAARGRAHPVLPAAPIAHRRDGRSTCAASDYDERDGVRRRGRTGRSPSRSSARAATTVDPAHRARRRGVHGGPGVAGPRPRRRCCTRGRIDYAAAHGVRGFTADVLAGQRGHAGACSGAPVAGSRPGSARAPTRSDPVRRAGRGGGRRAGARAAVGRSAARPRRARAAAVAPRFGRRAPWARAQDTAGWMSGPDGRSPSSPSRRSSPGSRRMRSTRRRPSPSPAATPRARRCAARASRATA